jgi:MerR family redox-sensitive transcriptional activator SoxR
MSTDEYLAIGEVAGRTGLAASAIRFYEAEGLIEADRTPSGQRRFHREVLRRLAFVRAAQTAGLGLEEIKQSLDSLPHSRTPNKADWEQLARSWRPRLDAQIAALELVRDRLTNCIGCGCLSLKSCGLYNPDDAAAALGPGARYLVGDLP